jgi:E1-E2 ATPase
MSVGPTLRAGDRAAEDGVVRKGAASLDVASLTGETVPIEVDQGAPILAGSIDTDGPLEVEVTRVGPDTTLGRSKTWRGLAAAILLAVCAAVLMSLPLQLGALAAASAMAGIVSRLSSNGGSGSSRAA